MKCSKCGQENEAGINFCVACGNALAPDAVVEEVKNPVAEAIAAKPTPKTKASKINFMDYLNLTMTGVLKPHKFITEETDKLANIKDSAILAALIGVIATVISLLKTMFGAVRTKNFITGDTSWNFENLGNVNYVKTIGYGLLITIGASFAIAGLYYIAGLIRKKEANFSKLVGISAIGLVPLFLALFLVAPILGMIHSVISDVVTVVGIMYTLIIIYEGINNEFKFEGNEKYFINLICLSIVMAAGYYIGINLLVASVTDSLSSALSGFSSLFN